MKAAENTMLAKGKARRKKSPNNILETSLIQTLMVGTVVKKMSYSHQIP